MRDETIFISYSNLDLEFAMNLVKDLKKEATKTWIDKLDIKPGEPWDASIQAALTSASRLIVILSPSAVGSNNVMDEVSFALNNKKIIIPVLIRECVIPLRLVRLHFVNCIDDYTTGLSSLLIALKNFTESITIISDEDSEMVQTDISKVMLNREQKKVGDYDKILNPEIKQNTSFLEPILEVDLVGRSRIRSPMGMSNKNPTEMHGGLLVMVPGPKPIIHWALSWRYKLVIHNNSNYPAFNVVIENISAIAFSEFEKLPDVNNIGPLNNLELKVMFKDWIESEHTYADELLKPRFPEKFKDLKLKLTYYDQKRNVHYSYVSFNENGLMNQR